MCFAARARALNDGEHVGDKADARGLKSSSAHVTFDCSDDGTDAGGTMLPMCRAILPGAIYPPGRNHSRPLMWMHVPKTGSSFSNALFRTACALVPGFAYIRTRGSVGSDAGLAQYFEKCFRLEVNKCEAKGAALLKLGPHAPLPAPFNPAAVAYVTMLREPLQRAVSGYNHHLHDCPKCPKDTTLVQYASNLAARGLYGKLILGISRFTAKKFSKSEARSAVLRLKQVRRHCLALHGIRHGTRPTALTAR